MNKLYLLNRKSFVRHYADIVNRGTKVFNKEIYNANLKKFIMKEEKNSEFLPFFNRSLFYDDRIAVKDSSGVYSYASMFVTARKIACQISNVCGSASSSHVGYICMNNVLCPLMQWSCWFSGQVAVPFDTTYPTPLINYIAETTKIKMIMSSVEFEKVAREVAKKQDIVLLLLEPAIMATQEEINESLRKLFINIGDMIFIDGSLNNDFYNDKTALIQYIINYDKTPLPLKYTHRDIHEQINFYVKTYDYCINDTLLNVVPHTNWHINLDGMSVFSVGGKVVYHDQLNVPLLWQELVGINGSDQSNANILIADPSTYEFLINSYAKELMHNSNICDYIRNYCSSNYKMMMTDYSKLPAKIYHHWYKITNHKLYERFIEIENPDLIDLEMEVSRVVDDAYTIGKSLNSACEPINIKSMETVYKKLLIHMLNLDYEDEIEQGGEKSGKRNNFIIVYKEMLVVFGGDSNLIEPFKKSLYSIILNTVVIRLIPYSENITVIRMPAAEGKTKHMAMVCVPNSMKKFNYILFEKWLLKVFPDYKKYFTIQIIENLPDKLTETNELILGDKLNE